MKNTSFFLILSMFSLSTFAQQYFATTGNYSDLVYDPQSNTVNYQNHVHQISRYGIDLDRLILVDGPDAATRLDLHGYQKAARILSQVLQDAQQFTGQGKIILDLTLTFFEIKDYGCDQSNWQPCLDYGNQDPVRVRPELRPDYQNRLADFMNQLTVPVDASDFEFISINNESGCTPASEIQAAAQAIKVYIPGVKVAAGYGISVDNPGIKNAIHYNPAKFPTALDRIIVSSYGVMDPTNDLDPLNAAPTFSAYYAIFLGALRWWQKIDWVIDAHFLNSRHRNGMGWLQGMHHAQAAVNWHNWLKTQPRVAGQIAFTYAPVPAPDFFSIAEMPQIVSDTYEQITAGNPSLPHLVVAADSFTGANQGTGLHGRPAEVGNVIWMANPKAIFGSGAQGDLTGVSGFHPIGVLPFNPSHHANKAVTITADINPKDSNWTALGFTKNALWGWWADGQVWVLIKPNGHYNVLADGTGISLTGGEVYDSRIHPDENNRVELRYDPIFRRVTLWINGYQLLTPTLVPGGFNPNIQYAGWSAFNATRNQTSVDNIEVKIDN